MYEIEYYETESGNCPVRAFLDDLEPKMKAKMIRTIELLEMNGPLLRGPHSEYLEDGVLELRAKQGSDISRVLFFFFVGQKAILTNGFTKKTQKTPRSEIELAKQHKADYERRYENDEI